MYSVKALDADGASIDIGASSFSSIDAARGFAVGVARWMLAIGKQHGQIDITSDGERVEGATFAYLAQPEFMPEQDV